MADLSLIQSLAKEREISMTELANRVGVSKQALFQIIRNNSTKIETLEKIADILCVSPAVFFGIQPTQADRNIELLQAKIKTLELMNNALEVQVNALKQANKILSETINYSK